MRLTPDADDKLRDIRSVTDAALSHMGADDLLTTLLTRVRQILDADTSAVLLDSSGRQLIASAASGLEEEVSQGVRIPVGQVNEATSWVRSPGTFHPGFMFCGHSHG